MHIASANAIDASLVSVCGDFGCQRLDVRRSYDVDLQYSKSLF